MASTSTVAFVCIAFFTVFSSIECACVDSSTNCAAWKANGFCNNPAFTAAQKLASCQRSCNLCTTVGTATCFDYSPSCTTWVANGFCSHTFYSDIQKATMCQYSCGLCATTVTCSASTGPCAGNVKCQNPGDVCTSSGCCPQALVTLG